MGRWSSETYWLFGHWDAELSSLHLAAKLPGRAETFVGCHRDNSGAFCASKFKEYPAALSEAFAGAITDEFTAAERSGRFRIVPFDDPSLVKWVHEAALASDCVRTDTGFLPDYQGR